MRRWWAVAALLLLARMIATLPSPTPALGSPEGNVVLSGPLVELSCPVGHEQCWGRIRPASLDGFAVLEGVLVRGLKPSWGDAHAGDVVAGFAQVRATASSPNPGRPEVFGRPDSRWHGRWVRSVVGLTRDTNGGPQLHTSLSRRFPNSSAGDLWRTVLLGDRRALHSDARSAFIDTGTAHLLAISGLHMAVMGWMLYRLCLALLTLTGPRCWGSPLHRIAGLVAIAGVWGYVSVIVPSESSLRAACMLTLVLLARALGRGWLAWRSLAIAGFILVLWEPMVLMRPSFQLSFTAVSSILLVLGVIRSLQSWCLSPGRFTSKAWVRVATWLLSALVISLATSLGTAPLALYWFGTWSSLGLLVNVLAVPWLTFTIIPTGLLGLAASVLSPTSASVIWPWLSWAPDTLMFVIAAAADFYGSAQHDAIGPLAAAALLSMGLAMMTLTRRSTLIVAFAILGMLSLSYPANRGLRLTMLDVGHGDSLTLRFPQGGSMLVDTGGGHHDAHNARLVSQRLVPALARQRMSQVDVLVITHADLDHVGAARRLLTRIQVGELWLPPCDHQVPAVSALAGQVLSQGGIVRLIHAGRPFNWQGVEVTPLWPPVTHRLPSGRCVDGPNASSMVLRLRYAGRSILLTGDIGVNEERALTRLYPDLSADVLKVAHHGSRHSTSSEWVAQLRPEVSLISGLFRGGRMPPHPSVAARLMRSGSQTYISGRDGAISVAIAPDGSLTSTPHRGYVTVHRGRGGHGARPP